MRVLRLLSFVLLAACPGSEGPKDTGTVDTGPSRVEDHDPDGDGFGADSDCDGDDPTIHPGAEELCDGVDSNCDGVADDDRMAAWFPDADGDGFGAPGTSVLACTAPAGHVADGTDCDDAAASVSPRAAETCDGLDQDCDGAVDEDAVDADAWSLDGDGDGFGDPATTALACAAPAGAVADASDCDDTDASVFPDAPEYCDGTDDDCDGTIDDGGLDPASWYRDADGDGYGDGTSDASYACEAPARHVADATDCDDGDAGRHPGADEWCDGGDDDCDGVIDDGALDALALYADADGDGFGDAAAPFANCIEIPGYTTDATDCDDTSDAVSPAAPEVCADGVDQDCSGADAACFW